MYTNYELLGFKMSLPEVTLSQDQCEVKVSFIGKDPQIQAQLAILSCELTTLRQQVFQVALQPDLIRIDSNARVYSQGCFEKTAGFGLVHGKIKIVVADLLNKQQAEVYFERGSDRKWTLEGINLIENAEIDRSALREKRRKLRRPIGDIG